MFPENDSEFQDNVISEVREDEDGWEVCIGSGSFFFLAKPSPVTPAKGVSIRTYGLLGHPIRGVFLNGEQVYYRSKAEEKQAHTERVRADQVKRKADFEAQRERYNERIAALPEIFQRRIRKFQENNADFDWEFGGYELFCCEQAWLFVTTLGTKDALEAWAKLPFDKQKEQVPGLDEGHSGNTFGCALRLAWHYMSEQENVVREHGALTPLVGCKAYGCPHPDDPNYESSSD